MISLLEILKEAVNSPKAIILAGGAGAGGARAAGVAPVTSGAAPRDAWARTLAHARWVAAAPALAHARPGAASAER